MNRIRTEPRARTNPLRRGMPMRTQIVPTNFDPETVWGVEALDPLQQRAWAEDRWREWYQTEPRRKPLLLCYHPAAERAAVRVLNSFARLSRSAECAPWVVLAESQRVPWLAPPVPALSLYLIHHASRIANVKAWLAGALAAPACRVALTAPYEEATLLGAAADFEVVEIPGEEASYCDAVADEILAQHFGAGAPLSALERFVIAAGVAEIALPLGLLARRFQIEAATLCETIARSRMRELVTVASERNTVAFRGAWLARKLMAEQESVAHETLFELVSVADVRIPNERDFLLQLLLAARAQGGAESAFEQHAEIFRRAQEHAEAGEEAQAWASVHARP